MNKTLLILTSAVFVLAGCQDETPEQPLAQAPAEQVTENLTVQVTDGIQSVVSQATSTLSEATSTIIRPEEAVSSAEGRLEHSARNSLDWEGVYIGTLPCADCSGIATSLTLNFDATYSYEQNYLGQGSEGQYKSTGEFIWNSKGDSVTLSTEDDSQQFFVGEGVLMMLDVDGNKVQGDMAENYNLVQQE
ncbi:lipoprotein [Vibrio ichthyoenteri ATCC 700023]|uniref:Lipoprotein n=1 Tax=Vibrio ichthyoenteri ATCC 700023 TaxID=870968 RepID=F9S0L1_9VIBR|nr:copper resistance protein NlpE [Vibrio ichthyoenteri]EGU43153.1 lipoprotein [Vibrio ichthyoenteri ATCC 700023]